MTFDFNLDAVSATEFGFGRDGDEGSEFGVVPVDAKVQMALLSMAQATMDRMATVNDHPTVVIGQEKIS